MSLKRVASSVSLWTVALTSILTLTAWSAPEPLLVSETKLEPPEPNLDEAFGVSVGMSGETLIVGAPQSPSFPPGQGAAYVFERDPSTVGGWRFARRVTPPAGAQGDRFGASVALDRDTAIVGAPWDERDGIQLGAAYVYQRDVGGPGNWGLVEKLTASDAAQGDRFGHSVSISHDTAVVGAIRGDGAETDSGTAYVFERDSGGSDEWGEVSKLAPPDGAELDFFGGTTGIDDDTIVVGAPNHQSGRVHVYRRDAGGAGTWGHVKTLSGSGAPGNATVGSSLDLDGDTAIAAAGSFFDRAYVFERNAGGTENWGEVRQLVPSGLPAGRFLSSVAIHGDVAIIGADGPNLVAGAVWVFQRDAGGTANWGEVDAITPFDSIAGDDFGRVVAMGERTALVASPVGGDGAAYVYDTPTVQMFVTSNDYAGDIGGLEGGDAVCRAEADAEALPGTWKAFLSVPGTDRFGRLPAGIPVERIDRASLADDSIDLSGPLDNPLDTEPGGATAPLGTHSWTGETGGGGSCLGFTSTVGDVGKHGLTSATGTDWYAAGDDACTTANRLYCFRLGCPAAPVLGCVDSFAKGTFP